MKLFYSYLCLFLFLIKSQFTYADTLLVLNKSDHTLSLFDERTHELKKTISVGKYPHEVSVSPTGRIAAVSNFGNKYSPGSTLSIIDIEIAENIKTIQLPKGARPHGLSFINEDHLLVTAEGIQELLIVDIDAGIIIENILVPGKGVHLVTTDSEKRFAYVPNQITGSVAKIDLLTFEATKYIKLGKAVEGIALSETRNELLVTNYKEHLLYILDAESFEIKATLKTGLGPRRVSSFRNDMAIVTNSISGTTQVFDLGQRKVIKNVKLSGSFNCRTGRVLGGLFGILPVPVTIQVREDNNSAYISHSFTGNIVLYDFETNKKLKVIRAGKEPDGLALSKVDVLVY